MRTPKALWARLGAMTWDEIPHRLREQVRRKIDRRPAVPEGTALPGWPFELRLTVPQFDAVWRMADRAVAVEPAPWDRCPRTGHRWAAGYAFDADVFAGIDPRPIWSVHRLRDLQLLAMAGASGHQGAAERCRERTLEWIRTHPPLEGIGWAAGIEVASRAASLVLIGQALGPDWSEADRKTLVDAIAAHLWYLRRYPSVGSSANNHAVAELGARLLLGDSVAEGFCAALVAMIRPDGSGVEEAPAYLASCLEWALLVRAHLDERALERLAAATRFLGGLLDGAGRSPAFGDDDGDAVLVGSRELWLFEICGLTASALERPDLCPVGWTPSLRAAVLEIGPCAGARAVESVEVGGGIVRLVNDDAVAWLNGSELGMPPMGAHGHADALSVVLHVAGRPVLIDTGTGTYLGDPEWRRWSRSAAAHNGLVVDRTDPVPQLGPFQWAPSADELWEALWFDPQLCEAGGRWRGWRGLIHHRRIRLGPDGLEIRDQVDGKGVRHLALPLYVAPGVKVPVEVDCDGLQTALRGQRVALGYGAFAEATCVWSEGEVQLPWQGTRVVRW